jgi:protein-tyrosine-phosphatase
MTALDRRTFGLSTLALLAGSAARAAPCAPPKVLFVCPAGTVKSAIAREAMRARAAKAGVAVDVRSRGLKPEDHVTPELAARLKAVGIDPKAEPVRALSPQDVKAADLVIAFDEAGDDPALAGARRWNTPSWLRDFDAAKADLDSRLDGLVAELAAGRPCAG